MRLFNRRPRIRDEDWSGALATRSVFDHLSETEARQLRILAERFLRRRQFRWADGIEHDELLVVAVAALACLPVVNLGLSWYSRWGTVLIVPGDYETDFSETDEAGVVHEGTDYASGEYSSYGLIVLSAPDVRESGYGHGSNVVIHEAAHVIDARDGSLDGAPALHAGMDGRRWTDVFTHAYTDLQNRVVSPHRRRADRARRRASAFDPYAAEAPEEFFAVASELFFERPLRLRSEYPDVYEQLSCFYRQDPADTRQ